MVWDGVLLEKYEEKGMLSYSDEEVWEKGMLSYSDEEVFHNE